MTKIDSPALPLTEIAIRILIILNGLMFAATMFLLVVPFSRRWMEQSLNLAATPDADRVVWGLRAIALIGLAVMACYYLVLKRLLAMVRSALAGEAFVLANAAHLRAIGWILFALQLCGLAIALIVDAISRVRPIDIDAGPSAEGWLAILLCFVLAQVFTQGARMRDDLEGTV